MTKYLLAAIDNESGGFIRMENRGQYEAFRASGGYSFVLLAFRSDARA